MGATEKDGQIYHKRLNIYGIMTAAIYGCAVRVSIERGMVITMEITYYPHGVCSSEINLTIEKGMISGVVFKGGCSGNIQGISKLVKGMKVEDVIGQLKGIKCGLKETSCPDQLAKALEMALEKEQFSA